MLSTTAMRRAAIAAACSIAATSGMAQETPVKGGRLDLVVQPEPTSLMIGITTNGPSLLVGGSIYEGLLRYDENQRHQLF